MSWQERVSVDPLIRGGKPHVKGTRITVYDIRASLAFAAARERRLSNSAP